MPVPRATAYVGATVVAETIVLAIYQILDGRFFFLAELIYIATIEYINITAQ